MAIESFTLDVVKKLNQLEPNQWDHKIFDNNQQPWSRIFRKRWNNRYLSSELIRKQKVRKYPMLWFEIKDVNKLKKKHNGKPPYTIYLPLDERGININDVTFVPIPLRAGHFLPNPDIYRKCLLAFKKCYLTNPAHWVVNVSTEIDDYLNLRYFVFNGVQYVLPRNSIRKELDSGIVTVNTETPADVDLCAKFILKRVEPVECAM